MVAVQSLSCVSLCNPVDCSTPGTPDHHYLLDNAQIHVHWVSVCAKSLLSCPAHSDPCTVACQAPLSMGFSKQEYWSRLPCPPPGHLPNPGIELRCPTLQADSLTSESIGKPMNTGVGNLSLLQGKFPT